MVKNLPSNARDMGSIPGRGTKILHAAGQHKFYNELQFDEQNFKIYILYKKYFKIIKWTFTAST